MKEKRDTVPGGKLLHSLQFPDDLLRGNALITLHGQEHLRVENFKGIVSYSEEEVRLAAVHGCVCIAGCHLRIVSYTKEEIEIAGHIRAVSFS